MGGDRGLGKSLEERFDLIKRRGNGVTGTSGRERLFIRIGPELRRRAAAVVASITLKAV